MEKEAPCPIKRHQVLLDHEQAFLAGEGVPVGAFLHLKKKKKDKIKAMPWEVYSICIV